MTDYLPKTLAEWIRLIVVALLVYSVSYCQGRGDGRDTERAIQTARLEKANRLYLEQKARADAAAADQRLADQRLADNLGRNLADAVANIPDSVPTARRLARACAQLRSQGSDTTALPQCR